MKVRKKKNIALPLILAIACFLLIGGTVLFFLTRHQHEWVAADCVKPKTCASCGETEGEPLGHTWIDATCTAPKTCSVCGATEGKALGHVWNDATCTEPKTCSVCGETEGEALGHSWIEATCTEARYCSVCGTTDGEALGHAWSDATCITPERCSRCGAEQGEALGHDWAEATCTSPKTCTRCGTEKGDALGHDWSEATYSTPKKCSRCGKTGKASLPPNGYVFTGADRSRRSQLTINASDSACFVKLKDASGNLVFSFFVRASESVTVKVPAGQYYVYFATGENWYGTKKCFGSNTSYSKDDEICDFSRYMYTYTLHTVENGNFSTTPIDSSEFN